MRKSVPDALERDRSLPCHHERQQRKTCAIICYLLSPFVIISSPFPAQLTKQVVTKDHCITRSKLDRAVTKSHHQNNSLHHTTPRHTTLLRNSAVFIRDGAGTCFCRCPHAFLPSTRRKKMQCACITTSSNVKRRTSSNVVERRRTSSNDNEEDAK